MSGAAPSLRTVRRGAGGDGRRGRGEVDVEVVGGEGEGAAFGVGDGERIVLVGSGGLRRLRLAGWEASRE